MSKGLEEIRKCNACGFCQSVCPVYRLTRHEGSSARGHQAHLKALLKGDARPAGKLVGHFGECLTCRACTTNCPPGVRTDRIVVEGRSRLPARGRGRLEKAAYKRILADPGRFKALMRLLKAGTGNPARRALEIMANAPLLPEGWRRASEMMPKPKGGYLSERIERKTSNALQAGTEVAFFMSCGMNYLLPDAGENTLTVFEEMGFRPKVLDNGCCGLPAYVAGDLDTARKMAARNLEVLTASEGPIVSDCASCSSFLKEYEMIMGEEAKAITERIQDFTQFAAKHWPQQATQAGRAKLVTYHDPCHLSRYQQVTREPRQLLQSLPGIEYRELPEADWCCGGAGTYAIKNPRISARILERKMENVRATGADILVTACPGCLLQLDYGAKRHGLPIRVMHISEMLAETSEERS